FWVLNNIAVAAAHAHLQHGIDCIVIFDIHLTCTTASGIRWFNLKITQLTYSGNGTQSIVWQMNQETYQQKLESEGGAPTLNQGPQVYYGAQSTISYPYEDSKTELVQATSVSIHGAHGQYIENVHLQEYTSAEHWEKTLRRAVQQ
ncbi:hypothetical protein B0H14DRAFT_2284065, partial [Mycena olivaceomarginata]